LQVLNSQHFWSWPSYLTIKTVWIYNYLCNQCLSPLTFRVRNMLKWGVLYTTLCDKVCQWLATCRWFFPGPPVSSTNKTDRHDIAEILVKVSLNTIPLIILFWLPCDYGCWNLTLNLIQLALIRTPKVSRSTDTYPRSVVSSVTFRYNWENS
jgi:hypothetical protein